MRSLQDILASKSSERTDAELEHLLSLTEPDDVELLRKAAFETTTATMGEGVYMRGLIEVSNICTANCRYCGIRKSNHGVERYTLQREAIIDCALQAHRRANAATRSGSNSFRSSSAKSMRRPSTNSIPTASGSR